MTPIAIVLVTLSAFAHAFWNFLSKRHAARPSAAFFLVASVAAAMCLLPLVIYYRRALALIPPSAWMLILITGIFQAIYYTGLAGAYRNGDMSVAYPLARALPAILIAAISLMLRIGKPVSGMGWLGILVVGSGCLILPLPRLRDMRLSSYLNTCCLLALMAACGTSGYTLIDNEVLRQLRALLGADMSNAQITLLFLELETISTALLLGLFVLLYAPERARLRQIWNSGAWYAALAGLIITGTYGLVLAAMAYATNVSYIAAFRQLSIPLGAVLGVVAQHEPRHLPKLIGIGLVVLGLVLVGLA